MYHFDDSTWPIAAVRIEGVTLRSDAAILQAQLAAWLAREQRFGILAVLPDGAVFGSKAEARAWLQARL